MVLNRGRREINEQDEKSIEINAKMQGTLSFKDPVNLKINGNFNGTLEVRGTLTIGSTAFVEAHITGDNIIIAGKVRGDIFAKKMLVLMPTGVLTGNIVTPKLNIVEGAMFQGKCQMMEDVLNIEELSRYLEIETPAIVELANNGKIPANKDGDNWTFERSKIDSWAANGKIN
ncbi:MAG: polymer-forming cytoskeletal protein [Candidatus Omnitrophota bacterium]|nr:polymer-forming cytoskeletal protein [Candidatus Omnitrophota bacterium]MDZ4243138.1 polymer-forming cytoskeletal protein [Candidatus Omnitrophota bacterium]